jgi:threonine dehydrogenase-like Zn-dependent dehydrogenase
MNQAYPRAIALAKRGAIDLKSIISHRVSLKDTAKAFKWNHS